MTRGIFITGTDTGVGKTLVTAGILRWLIRMGIDATPMKPVQTGAEKRNGGLIAPDIEVCLQACGRVFTSQESSVMTPYLYVPACSPHLAGRLEGRYPELSVIVDCARKLEASHQVVVVEGAGGIKVPLNESEIMLDLMKALGYPVILVSTVGLGSINHALLSIEALRSSGISLIGIVFNQTAPAVPADRFIEQDNPDAIARFGQIAVLGNIPFIEEQTTSDEKWAAFERAMPGLYRIEQIIEQQG